MSSATDDVPDDDARHGELGPPADAPCRSCPYRRDVPSGVWDIGEYEKLVRYDRDTGQQPTGVFQCHLTAEHNQPDKRRRPGKPTDGLARICAGWAGCHDGDNLLSLRMAIHSGLISPETANRTITYVSPVSLWESGAAAAAHGVGSILNPSEEARRIIDKLVRVYGKSGTQDTTDEPATSLPDPVPSEAPPLSATTEPVSVHRAAKAVHGFLIDSTGFDVGQPMIEQAADLAGRLADAGLLANDAGGPPGQDVTTLIREFIVDNSGEDLGPLTTDLAEQLRDVLASAGLLGDGVFTPLSLSGQRDDRSQSS